MMGDRHGGDWVRAVGEVQRAIRACLDALDRYEAKFADLLGGAVPPPPHRPDPWPDLDDRLTGARTEAAAVDQLLAEQEAAWVRWLGTFTAWRRSLEQPPGPAAAPGA